MVMKWLYGSTWTVNHFIIPTTPCKPQPSRNIITWLYNSPSFILNGWPLINFSESYQNCSCPSFSVLYCNWAAWMTTKVMTCTWLLNCGKTWARAILTRFRNIFGKRSKSVFRWLTYHTKQKIYTVKWLCKISNVCVAFNYCLRNRG